MKKTISIFLTCLLLCFSVAMPVNAAEAEATSNLTSYVELARASSYFSKITPKLNSLTGTTASANLSSGTCLGTTQNITSVTVYCRVSSGSSPFTLKVKSPSGTIQTKNCGTSSTTYTFTGFNGEDPDGTWTIYISTKGAVSTVTSTLKTYYNYQ